MFDNVDRSTIVCAQQEYSTVSQFHMDKLFSTLKQIQRDWSIDGINSYVQINELFR